MQQKCGANIGLGQAAALFRIGGIMTFKLRFSLSGIKEFAY
jgi:hypothetical protein